VRTRIDTNAISTFVRADPVWGRPFYLSGYPLRSSADHSKKTFDRRDTEDKETFKEPSGVLCALCVSSERNERVVKRIINPDNSYWSEVDNQNLLNGLEMQGQ